MKQNDYEHSRPLDMHGWPGHKDINNSYEMFHSLFYDLYLFHEIFLRIN